MFKRFRRAAFLCMPVFFCMFSCQQKSVDPAVEYVDVNGQTIPKVSVELIDETEEIMFTDWFEDIRLVELETTDKSMFRYAMRTYVGDEYIIVSTGDHGVLMFSSEGKFIKAIAPHGGGPGEVSDPNRNVFVDEKNHKAYITLGWQKRDMVLSVEIMTGDFDYIKFQNTGGEFGVRDVIVVNDSLMYCTTMAMKGRESSCPLFCQTTSERLLWEMDKTHPDGLTNAGIRLMDGEIYFSYLFKGDTTYQLVDQELVPIATIFTDKPRSYPEATIGSMYAGMQLIAKDLYQGGFAYLEDKIVDEQYGYERDVYSKRQRFMFNSKTGKAFLFGDSFKNDYLGFNDNFHPQIHENRVATVVYQAVDLVEYADSVYNLPETPKEQKDRLGEILERVDMEDNPCILVGYLKKKI